MDPEAFPTSLERTAFGCRPAVAYACRTDWDCAYQTIQTRAISTTSQRLHLPTIPLGSHTDLRPHDFSIAIHQGPSTIFVDDS